MRASEIIAFGYFEPKMLATGEWAALHRFMFTTGLLVGIDNAGYRTRFCYPQEVDAKAALQQWNGQGDPPGPWIKQKGGGGDRSNPNIAGIPVAVEGLAHGNEGAQ